MADGSVHQHLLKEAAKLVGKEQLARGLRVPQSVLEAWMNGHATMPERKLLLLADLLDRIGSVGPKNSDVRNALCSCSGYGYQIEAPFSLSWQSLLREGQKRFSPRH